MRLSMDNEPDEPQIPKYYAGKKILITGGTGYMGKMLIWKLLQSCPSLDTIYALVRPKYGKTPMSRKNEVLGNMMFDEFKKNSPQILNKVVFIAGDVGEEGIGLSQQDRDLLTNHVTHVFHGAAVLKMDSDLKFAINVNTEGTLRMLRLAEKMDKLEAFVYISTAYCCCDNESVEEKIYPSPQNPYHIMDLVRWMDPKMLHYITPKLIHPLPNTYTYSKRLTESLLPDFVSKIPLIIARPTIVIPSIKEPVPGWVDNMNGPTGIFVAGGKGVLRVTAMNKRGKPNFVAVDVAVNGIITLPWANSKENLLKEVAVYNVGQTEYDQLTWEEAVVFGFRSALKLPYEKVLWYPNTNNIFENSLLIYNIRTFFSHWLPAYILDFILVLIGQKPFLVRTYSKIQAGEEVLRYFTKQDWFFANEKLLRIRDTMNEADKAIYPVTMKTITDTELYMDKAIWFNRKYLCNEDPSTIEWSKKKMKMMYLLDKFILALKYILLFKFLTQVYYAFSRLIEFHYQYQT